MEVKGISQGWQSNLNMNNLESFENIEGEFSTEGNSFETKGHTFSKKTDVKEEDVKKAVEKLNKLLEDKETYLEYEVHGKHKDIIVKIMNKKTKKVVKEIPPKKIVDMVNKFCELAGIFIQVRV